MPRLLIRDAHEWINEIPTVPSYHLANQLRQGNGLEWLSGERRPCWVWLQSQFVGRHRRCSYRWEALPVLKNHFFYRCSANPMIRQRWLWFGVPHSSPAIRASFELLYLTMGSLQRCQFTFFRDKHALRGVWAFVWKQDWDGEFGWGGISAKHQRRCPKASSVRTETWRGAQGQKLAWS